MEVGLVVWLWTNYIDSVCQKQVPILNASVSVVQGFSKMVRVMHLGLDVWALTHACFNMFKTEKMKASFENRSLILLYLQFPCLWNGDSNNTYHPADGKESHWKFLRLPYTAVGGRTFTVTMGQCLCLKLCSFTRGRSGTQATAWAAGTAIIRAK